VIPLWECACWVALGLLGGYRLGLWLGWRRSEQRVMRCAWSLVDDRELKR